MPAKTYRSFETRRRAAADALRNARTVVVFDTETTGLTKKDQIIQFSGIEYDVSEERWKEVASVDILIRPDEPVSQEIAELTGHTNEELNEYPFEDRRVAASVADFLCGADALVAYNSPFDISMVSELFRRQGISAELPPVIDALPMVRDLLAKPDLERCAKRLKREAAERGEKNVKTGPHKLASARALLIEQGAIPDTELRYHNAFDDVEATAEVAEVLLGRYSQLSKTGHDERWRLLSARMWCSSFSNSMNRYCVTIKNEQEVVRDIFFDADALVWSYSTSKKSAAELRHLEEVFDRVDFDALEADIVERFGRCQAVLGESEIPATTIDSVVIPLHWEKRRELADEEKRKRTAERTSSAIDIASPADDIELD